MRWRHWVFQSTWGSYQNTDTFCWQFLVSCWFKSWYNHFSPVMELLLFPSNDELREVKIILQQPTITSYCVQWFVYKLYITTTAGCCGNFHTHAGFRHDPSLTSRCFTALARSQLTRWPHLSRFCCPCYYSHLRTAVVGHLV